MALELRYFISESNNPHYNLAVEEFLTFSTKEEECILYLWQNEKTVVIGKNQNAYKECKVSKLEEDGGSLVRRLSGGGAVYHDLGNLNFTFCIRKNVYDLEKQLQVILDAVKACGISASLTGRNDITVDGKKFSGNAYYDSGEYAYNHGTIMIDVDSSKLSDYLTVSAEKLKSKGVDSVKSRVGNLRDYNPNLTIEQMKQTMISAFEKTYGGKALSVELSREDETKIQKLQEKYESIEWKYGRNIPFSNQFSKRFDWGEVQISLDIKEGVVHKIKVYTDALDSEFSVKLEQRLIGCLYRKEEILNCVQGCEGALKECLLWISDCI